MADDMTTIEHMDREARLTLAQARGDWDTYYRLLDELAGVPSEGIRGGVSGEAPPRGQG